MQTYAFLLRSGLRKTEHIQFVFGANKKVFNCARKKNPKQVSMYLDTVLEGSSLLREQDVAHHSQWKGKHFFYCFPFKTDGVNSSLKDLLSLLESYY